MPDPIAPPSNVDEHVFLIGRPPLGEFLSFIQVLAVNGQTIPQGQLAAEWRVANDHVRELETREAGWANNPTISEIPESQIPLRSQVLADQMFQRSFQLVPADIHIVELDRLVVFQKFINLGYVHQLQRELGPNPTEDEIFRFCLPVHHPHPPAQILQTAQNAYTFLSLSNDFRFVEATMFDPSQIINYVPQGPVTAVLGLVIGYGSNFLNAFHVENRLVLNNGSHRAYALRDIGVTHVPCLMQSISRREELEVLTGGPQSEVFQNADRYLKIERPPVLKDYFDPILRKIVPVVRKQRYIRITYGVEATDIPSN